MKTTVHVAIFVTGLVEVELADDGGNMHLNAGINHISKSEISACHMPKVSVAVGGEDRSDEVRERVTRVASHLLLQEVERRLRAKLEETATLVDTTEYADDRGAKA